MQVAGQEESLQRSDAGFWTRRKLAGGEITQVAGPDENLHRSIAGFWTRRKLTGQVLEVHGPKRCRVFLVFMDLLRV
jgi:hypothetical protein